MPSNNQELTKVFSNLLEEYVSSNFSNVNEITEVKYNQEVYLEKEVKLISEFLSKPCPCGKNCQAQFSFNEIFHSRADFRLLTKNEKNCFILSQLKVFKRFYDLAKSGRSNKTRERQKFEYHINIDRPVCRNVFLFYYGETLKRLKYLQKHLIEVGISMPIHGNTSRIPKHALSSDDKAIVGSFIVNFSAAHGMPDPGRDLRTGKGKLRVLLPAVLNYMSVYRIYQKSTLNNCVSYRAFVRIWHEVAPHICFMKPRSDLCMMCEDFKKALNRIASDLTEERDNEKIKLHQQAIEHLERAKKERNYYSNCIKLAEQNFATLGPRQRKLLGKPNSRRISMHYSWDFAQKLHYPYEDQQVGPIYFKTPRRAQVFGVCCEGIPRQVNYLIDEADFIEKNANTVISLLDHFFDNYGVGEKYAYLTADNCVGQNKNNAILHYLMYRVLMGLHEKIDLSFMLVGHTKFAPDGYFGLIKYRYRRLKIYTYDQLAKVIEESSEKGHNVCQRYRDNSGLPNFSYRDWSIWFSKYFKKLPNITKYHHFHFDYRELGVVKVKKEIDGTEEKHILLKKNSHLTSKNNHVAYLRSLSLLDCLPKELGIFMKKFVNIFLQQKTRMLLAQNQR